MKEARSSRLILRFGGFVYFTTVLVVFLVVLILLWYRRKPVGTLRFVIAGQPVVVVAIDTNTKQLVVVSIPSDVIIEATGGYGRYALGSLWHITDVDKRPEAFVQSVEETVGIPIMWHVGMQREGGRSIGADPKQTVVALLQPSSLFRLILRSIASNLPAAIIFRLWQMFPTGVYPQDIRYVDIGSMDIFDQVVLPDGTVTRSVNTDALDTRLSTLFVDDEIRLEALRITIVNTTDVPRLGQRVARTLGNIGAYVIAIENDRPQINRCRITGTAPSLQSNTALLIRDHYGCDVSEESSGGRADLVVRIGAEFKRRFLPRD